MIKSVIYSIKNQRSVIFLIYGVQLLFAFGLGLQVWHVLEASMGDSLSMNAIQEGFNRTVFEDFLQVHGASITPLIGILRWIIPVYLLFAIFFHTGIIYNITKGKNTIKTLIKGGTNYYLKSLLITFAGLGIMMIIALLIWIPFFIIVGNPFTYFDNEKYFIFWIAALSLINLIALGMVWWWSFALRTVMIGEESNFIPWKAGTKAFRKGIFSYMKISIFFIIINILIYFVYAFLTNDMSAKSVWIILLLFIFQQVFNICRIGIRVGYFKVLIGLTHPR